jgi:hypothetical protein
MRIRIISILSVLLLIVSNFQFSANAAGQQGLNMVVRGNLQDYQITPPYGDTLNFSGVCLTDVVPNIDFSWGEGGPSNCPNDGFTTYFYGFLKAPITGNIYFYDVADDGFYLEINGQTVISNWEDQATYAPNGSGFISLTRDQIYVIKVWHYENWGGAAAQLYWNTTSDNFNTSVIVPSSAFATDPTYWNSSCTYKGNSGNANNSVGSNKAKGAATTKSNGLGVCQNASNR